MSWQYSCSHSVWESPGELQGSAKVEYGSLFYNAWLVDECLGGDNGVMLWDGPGEQSGCFLTSTDHLPESNCSNCGDCKCIGYHNHKCIGYQMMVACWSQGITETSITGVFPQQIIHGINIHQWYYGNCWWRSTRWLTMVVSWMLSCLRAAHNMDSSRGQPPKIAL